MKHFYQYNNLETKISKFYNANHKRINEKDLPNDIQKVAMGFPYAILFHPPLEGKIYAYVIDKAGRKQYFYTKKYKEKMSSEKYKKFPKLIDKVDLLLNYCRTHKNNLTTAILLMNDCHFRIGHEKYKKLYNTNGTLSLGSSHMEKKDGNIKIEFLGKKKEKNICILSKKESNLYKTIDDFIRKNGNKLFNDLKYDKVYDFLRDYGLRPKDIRQVSANKEFYNNMRRYKFTGDYMSKKDVKKYLKNLLEVTSESMNHTAGVCKKEYLMPQWFLLYGEDFLKMYNYIKKSDFKKSIKYIIKK